MSDRPTPVNGKRHQAWGTTSECPECGQCLCFGCHPDGPCIDEQEARAAYRHSPFATRQSSIVAAFRSGA